MTPKRVVVDANIYISALLSPQGTPAAAVRAALESGWEIVGSDHITRTVINVAERPHIARRFPPQTLNAYLNAILRFADVATPDPLIAGFAGDAEDDAILGAAVAGNADVIVTGDAGLLKLHPFRGIAILKASDFLTLIDP